MLLAMHTRSVRSRKEIKRSDQQQGAKQQAAAIPAVAQTKAPEKAADGQEVSTRAGSGGFRLPNLLPRLPRIHVGESPMDMEAFIRNRRTGQMLATKDSLLKMDRLMHLRQKQKIRPPWMPSISVWVKKPSDCSATAGQLSTKKDWI